MAELTIQTITATGTTPSLDAADSGGDYVTVANHERSYVYALNGSGGSLNVTVKGKIESNQGETNDNVVAVPAGEDRYIPIRVWEVSSSNRVDIEYSAVTSLNVGVFQVGD
jgi:hypothetical protein